MFSSLLQEGVFIRDAMVAADWCRRTQIEGSLQLPAVLYMDIQKKKELHMELKSWEAEYAYYILYSSAGMLMFALQKMGDFELFDSHIVDQRHLKVFSRFEEE